MVKNALQKHRERVGFSREKLATLIGKSYSSIVAYEQGTRDPDTVIWIKLAEMYDVTVDDLMGVERKYPFNASDLEENWPELVQVLRTHGKSATSAERRRIANVIRACLEEDVDK